MSFQEETTEEQTEVDDPMLGGREEPAPALDREVEEAEDNEVLEEDPELDKDDRRSERNLDDDENRGPVSTGFYNAQDIIEHQFEELHLTEAQVDAIVDTWNAFIRSQESREQAGGAIFSALFEVAPSLQGLFKTARAVMILRFMTGMNNVINSLGVPSDLKTIVETMGFQHMEFDVSLARVTVFRDSFTDVLNIELGSQHFHSRAREAWQILLNYIGGAFIYVRVKYAERLRILASSWATANNKSSEETITVGEIVEEEGGDAENAEGNSGEAGAGTAAANNQQRAVGNVGTNGSIGDGASNDGDKAKNTSVPQTFNDMFTFNAAVMGFGNSQWMMEVLQSFDTIVVNVSNTYRLQEECDVLGLRLAKYKEAIHLPDFKAVMLASLRSLVPKDWNSAHEVAWSWLWDNVERLIKQLTGKPEVHQRALSALFENLTEEDMHYLKKEIYVEFFRLAPAGQDHFKQSTTRLHFISGKVVLMTLDMLNDPKSMVDTLSAVGLRHAGYGIPTDLFGPYVSACVGVMSSLTDNDAAQEAYRWSLSLISRIMMRVINEGSTIVMKAINVNSAKQLTKAVACAPRGKRALWMLNVQVGTQSISPLLWSIETGSLDAAQAIIVDLLTIRADRDRYYYGMDTLFSRHPDIVKRLCVDAPVLMPVLLDGLIWRSRTTEDGKRRVNYYVKHLVMNPEGLMSKAIEWVTETKDPKLVCHPVLSLVTDMIWSQVCLRSFLFGKTWFLFTLVVFVTSQSILSRIGQEDATTEPLEKSFAVRIGIFACRLFIYVFSLGHWVLFHVKALMADWTEGAVFRIMGRIPLPMYLLNWQDAASFLLTGCLLMMLFFEPILHCIADREPGVDIEFSEICSASKSVSFPYSVFSTIAMLLYFSLLIDLSVFSTRISAFALVCFRVLSEVFLFLFGLVFLVVGFAAAISSLEQELEDFSGIMQSALSLLKISFGMLDGKRFDVVSRNPSVMVAVFAYVITTVVFLLNLLIAQLNCAYAATFQDMLGYARINRGKILTETMPAVNRRRWQAFVDTLKLDESVEFGEGDIGVPGGFQILEPASANITTVDMIRRFGGSTSPAACWPEEEGAGEDDEDRFDRMEKYIERAVKRASMSKSNSGKKGSGSMQSGTASSGGEGESATRSE